MESMAGLRAGQLGRTSLRVRPRWGCTARLYLLYRAPISRDMSPIFLNDVFNSSGIAGGVASMQGFLERFFPEVILQKQEALTSTGNKDYCQFDSQASLLP